MPQAPGPRRFKALSEAVRAGCVRYPLPRRDSHDPAGGLFGRRALHAAWIAEFEKDHPDGYATAEMVGRYPELREDVGVFCPFVQGPLCREWPPLSSRSLEQAIVHLEDVHGRRREQIALWLEAHGW
jgi:hypothetical protein